MTLEDILRKASEYLKERNVEDPSKEAGLLLSWAFGKSLGSIYAHLDLIIDDKKATDFFSAVERRGRHEPFAYITGECEFLSLNFEVNKYVLIPRPDTEILAEAALVALGKNPFLLSGQDMFRLKRKDSYRLLDIGTGSGCLSVSITKNAANVNAYALDISENALETAKRNAQRHGVSDRINFVHADFLSNKTTLSEKYDLIISNPPYIPEKDITGLMASVKNYEPRIALVGGDKDGLLFYRVIADKAKNLLSQEGIIAVECGFDQASQIQDLFSEKGMDTLLLMDLSGINRVVVARKVPKV